MGKLTRRLAICELEFPMASDVKISLAILATRFLFVKLTDLFLNFQNVCLTAKTYFSCRHAHMMLTLNVKCDALYVR